MLQEGLCAAEFDADYYSATARAGQMDVCTPHKAEGPFRSRPAVLTTTKWNYQCWGSLVWDSQLVCCWWLQLKAPNTALLTTNNVVCVLTRYCARHVPCGCPLAGPAPLPIQLTNYLQMPPHSEEATQAIRARQELQSCLGVYSTALIRYMRIKRPFRSASPSFELSAAS
jgi:hypothetical protein